MDLKTEKFLTTKELSELLNINIGTLRNWRVDLKGPKYIKLGSSVRYRMSDILDFLNVNTKG